MSNVFKAYDIRGIYPDELNKELAFKVGMATVKFLQAKNPGKKLTLVIGEDCRLASPALRGAVVDAITRSGADVYYIGQSTTPLFYFSVNKLKADGGIMVTASHLAAQFCGLKIVGYANESISRGSGLEEIERLAGMDMEFNKNIGTIQEVSTVDDYINFVIDKSGINAKKLKKLKIVIDASNGMGPIVLEPLLQKIGISYSSLYFNIDCSFPNHSPDVSRTEALTDLKRKVLDTGADFGAAFDADADRIFFVDNHGNKVNSDFILALLFRAGRGLFSAPKVVYDLRYSKDVRGVFGPGGTRSKVGYVNIRKNMIQRGADIGGELSGHFFFKDIGYEQSTALVLLKIIKIMADENQSLSEMVREFQKSSNTGEINIELGSEEKREMVIAKIRDQYKDGKMDDLDGVTVDYDDWWFNLRPSNTESIVRLIVEAKDKDVMKQKVDELTMFIKKSAL